MQEKSEKPDPDTENSATEPRPDRLSSLMERFSLRVGDAAAVGRLAVIGGPVPEARFWPLGQRSCPALDGALVLGVDWGGAENPLLSALPQCVVLSAEQDAETGALIHLIQAEAEAARCGVEGVLARLTEVLLIRLLRAEIERGAQETGLIGGLACPRISRALVAIHGVPGRAWTNRDLAGEAGLSLSRFTELFAARVGETPKAYLRRWRLTLARQQLVRGARVGRVAHALGYGSAEALTRAFQARYGEAPRDLRMAAAAGEAL
ncbi:MAG: AraC family transcriptional regulator [Pseudomonadota bacterium]